MIPALLAALSLGAAPGGAPQKTENAIFAGGCFWCMEPPFDALDGVISTESGYTGGHKEDPTYKEVSSGTTGHREAVRVIFAPAKVNYEKLLEVFWRNIDPHDAKGQFCDKGEEYTSAIFFDGPMQEKLARESKAKLSAPGRLKAPVVTAILPAAKFYPAEDYHQDYYRKNPIRYKYYRFNCSRDSRLKEVWGEK